MVLLSDTMPWGRLRTKTSKEFIQLSWTDVCVSSEGIKALGLSFFAEGGAGWSSGDWVIKKAQDSFFFGVLHKNALFQTGFIQGSMPMVIWWLTWNKFKPVHSHLCTHLPGTRAASPLTELHRQQMTELGTGPPHSKPHQHTGNQRKCSCL